MKPPSDVRALFILLKFGWLRAYRRFNDSMSLSWFSKKKKEKQRTPTPGKHKAAGIAGMCIMGGLMLLVFGMMGMQAVGTFLASIEDPDAGATLLDWNVSTSLRLGGRNCPWRRINHNREPGAPPRSLDSVPCDAKADGRTFDTYADYVGYYFNKQAEQEGIAETDQETYVSVRVKHYEQHGPDGFELSYKRRFSVKRMKILFSSRVRPNYAGDPLQTRGVGILSLFVVFAVFFIGGSFGMVQRAGKTAALDDLEWTMTYPVCGRTILGAQLLRTAVLDVFGWIILLPVFFFVYISAGYGWFAVPLTLVVTLSLKIMCSGMTLLNQIAIPLVLRPRRAATCMAVLSMTGMICYFCFLFLAQARSPHLWLRTVAEFVPNACLLLPPLAPSLITAGGVNAVLGICLTMFGGVATAMGSVTIAGFLLRRGRPRPSEENRRMLTNIPSGSNGLVNGVLRTELLFLIRNRGFLVQVLFLPLIILGFNGYILFEMWMKDPVLLDFRHVAAIAYGVGAYSSIFSASTFLNNERSNLWMLYTLPRSVGYTLAKKSFVSGCLCLFHPLLILIVFACAMPFSIHYIPLMILSVSCAAGIAVVSAGIFVLGMNPFATERKNAIGGVYVLVQMFLMSMPIAAFYSQSAWTQIGTMVALWLIGLAVWQKVHDRCPYMLDPVTPSPQKAGMADGLIAGCVFFFIQTLLSILFLIMNCPMHEVFFWSYVWAGIATLAGTALSFLQRGVSGVSRIFGLRPLEQHTSAGTAIGYGCIAGAAAALIGVAYLYILQTNSTLQVLYNEAQKQTIMVDENHYVFAILAVIAAPLIEEPLFRGLLFNSIRRSISEESAMFASAAIFALVHPAIAAFPVFILGLFAAWSYRKSGRLVSAVLAHAMYNSAIVYLH